MSVETFKELMNYGWPTAALVFVAWGAWRIITFLGQRLFDDEHGLVTKWVASQQLKDRRMASYLDAQEKRDLQHVKLCQQHAAGIDNITESMAKHDLASKVVYADVVLFKAAALEGCELLRKWVTAFPDHQEQLRSHVDAIDRIIRDTR